MKVEVGTCGWGYLNPNQYFGKDWRSKFKDKLQAYVYLFDVGEVNYTFYKLPPRSAMELWRKRADEIKPNFEFSLKVSKYITHVDKFRTENSIVEFNKMKDLADALRARILVLQTPSSFKPTHANISVLEKFFSNIDRENFIIGLEVRGKEWLSNLDKLKNLLEKHDILHITDIFACKPVHIVEGIAYFRLHGSPPSKKMYYYQFNDKDFEYICKGLKEIKEELGCKKAYVMFNNVWMYDDAQRFREYLRNVTL